MQLVPYLSVLENLVLHDRASQAEARQWLERFELENRIDHKPEELSHGQRQRIALIRAIVHQPSILVTDEPTGNLDEKNSLLVMEILRHFADSGGAVLIASHDPAVEKHADRIYELADKTLAESCQTGPADS